MLPTVLSLFDSFADVFVQILLRDAFVLQRFQSFFFFLFFIFYLCKNLKLLWVFRIGLRFILMTDRCTSITPELNFPFREFSNIQSLCASCCINTSPPQLIFLSPLPTSHLFYFKYCMSKLKDYCHIFDPICSPYMWWEIGTEITSVCCQYLHPVCMSILARTDYELAICKTPIGTNLEDKSPRQIVLSANTHFNRFKSVCVQSFELYLFCIAVVHLPTETINTGLIYRSLDSWS